MSWQAKQQIPWPIGGQSLASGASVTGDAIVGSPVVVGKGLMAVVLTVTGYSGGSGFDLINLRIQANSRAAATTWYDIGEVTFGDATAIGEARTSADAIVIPVLNESDYQIRLFSYIQGSATAATVTADVYPIPTKNG